MQRTKIVDLLRRTDFGATVCVKGWVRTRRGSKSVNFIALNDGSTILNVQVVADVAEDLGETLAKAKMVLTTELPASLRMRGNYSLLYAIFRNLMENSARYAGQGAELHVVCYNRSERVANLSVYDTGQGVPEAHLPRLFERFYRVEKGRSRKLGGTGLGLAIVKNAVLVHGGSIQVNNNPNGGLRFDFSLKS